MCASNAGFTRFRENGGYSEVGRLPVHANRRSDVFGHPNFIPVFARIADPLTGQLKEGKSVIWKDAEKKKKLAEASSHTGYCLVYSGLALRPLFLSISK